MAYRKRVVIVGAGILGAAVAHALYRRGETDVLVLDRQGPASGASGLGAGLLSHLTWDPRNVRLVARSRELYAEVAQDPEPVPFLFHETGGLLLAGEDHLARLRELQDLQTAAGADVALLDPEEIARLPGGDAMELGDVAAALHAPKDGWGMVSDAVRRLLGEAHVDGAVQVRWFDAIERVEPGPAVVLAGGRRVEAEAVVVAAGAWTPRILGASDLPVPVAGYRTQVAILDWTAPPGFPLLHDALHDTYARPEGQGFLMGDGTDLSDHDPEDFLPHPDRAFLEHVAEAASHRIPATAGAHVTAGWAGVEAGTPDRHPLVGPDPRLDGLHLAVGGNGFGFMRAPALGEVVACGILGERPPVEVPGFEPGRFEGTWDQDVRLQEGFTL